MANVYTISAPGSAFVAGKCMLGVFNGSAYVVRVYRAFVLNNQTTAVTGLNNLLRLDRFTTGSGGTEVLSIRHDSSSVLLPSSIICSTNMSFTTDVTFRRMLWSSDEPLASDAANVDEFQTIPKIGKFLDADWSYLTGTVEPYVLRTGYGLGVVCENAYSGSTVTVPVGSADVFIEFTVETT